MTKRGEEGSIGARVHITLSSTARTSQNAVLPNTPLPFLIPALDAEQCVRRQSAPVQFSAPSISLP